MSKVETIVQKLTREETLEMLQTVLNELPEAEAITILKDWIKDHNLEAEFSEMD